MHENRDPAFNGVDGPMNRSSSASVVPATLRLVVMLLAAAAPLAVAQSQPAGATHKAAQEPGVVKKVGNAVEHGVKVAASGVERGVSAAAGGVKKAGNAVARGAQAAGSAVNTGAKKIGVPTDAASAPRR
jgi:hypothetical protein